MHAAPAPHNTRDLKGGGTGRSSASLQGEKYWSLETLSWHYILSDSTRNGTTNPRPGTHYGKPVLYRPLPPPALPACPPPPPLRRLLCLPPPSASVRSRERTRRRGACPPPLSHLCRGRVCPGLQLRPDQSGELGVQVLVKVSQQLLQLRLQNRVYRRLERRPGRCPLCPQPRLGKGGGEGRGGKKGSGHRIKGTFTEPHTFPLSVSPPPPCSPPILPPLGPRRYLVGVLLSIGVDKIRDDGLAEMEHSINLVCARERW